jgi:Uncharacterized conserved protein
MIRLALPLAAPCACAVPAFAQDAPPTPIGEVQRGTFATVAGDVSRILDEDTFRLQDATGRIRVYIGPNRMPVRAGDTVVVEGFVDDDPGPRELYADTLTLPDGTVVTFERRYD